MLVTGFSLAVLTCAGFWLIYVKLPQRIKNFMVKHSLFTDMVACFLTYALFGGTLTALFAAAFTGIFISILLALLNNEITAEALKMYAEKLKTLKAKFVDYVAQQVKTQERVA
jgi:hypothetical protein